MIHGFDVDVAKKYGADGATIINHLMFWIQKNQANSRHEHEGYCWTYNSLDAFAEIFPYWNAQKINRILKKLEDKGAIKTNRFNKIAYDRTLWYTVIDKWIYQKYNLHLSKVKNGTTESDSPIPDILPVVDTDAKTILSCFNQFKGNGHFKPVEANLKFIRDRLKKYSKEEVIETAKFMSTLLHRPGFWLNTNPQYYRPSTIFNATKFSSYYEQWKDSLVAKKHRVEKAEAEKRPDVMRTILGKPREEEVF